MREYGGRVSIPTPDTRTYPSIDELTSKRRKSIRVVVPSIVDSLPVYPIFLSRLKRHLDWISILSTPPTNSIKLLPPKLNRNCEYNSTIPRPISKKISSDETKSKDQNLHRPTVSPLLVYRKRCTTLVNSYRRIRAPLRKQIAIRNLGRSSSSQMEPICVSIRQDASGQEASTVSTPDRVCEGAGEGAKEVAAIGYRTCLDACVAARASQHRIRPRLILDARR